MGTSALFLAIFLMAILRDVKRVVQHQGYLRLDVQVEFEKLKETIPESTRSDPEKLTAWMTEAIAQVQTVYASLDPDDTYVHTDSITINNPVGSASADALEAVDSLFNVCERMAVRALKTMPILLATTASRTETQANREWEIYAKGIETLQHFVESACEYVFKLALQAQGKQCNVKVRFETFRAAEKMRDAQVDYLVAKLARFLYDSGVIGMKEMAQMCGRKDADAEEPRASMSGGALDNDLFGTNNNPNEGEERFEQIFKRMLENNPDILDRFLSGAPDKFENLN